MRSKFDYSTWMINLDEMRRHGIEFELNGQLFDNLWFHTSYAFMAWKNMGGEAAGEVAAAEHPKHMVKAGLRFSPLAHTLVMLDYQFQTKRLIQTVTGTEEDFDIESIPVDAFQVVDLGVEHTLFEKYGHIKNAVLKIYVNNLFDEAYESSRGFPMTDRSYGASLNFRF